MCPVEDVVENAIVDKILTFLDESEGECTDLAIRKLCKCTFNDVWEALYNIFDARNPTQTLSLYGFMMAVKDRKHAYIPDRNNRLVIVKMSRENNEGPTPIEINDWCDTIHSAAKESGWWEGDINFPEKLALIHSEISEALEEYRNGKDYTETYYNEGKKPEGIPVELADAVIRIMDLCGYYGIDLQEAIRIKHEYNLTRSRRHGGKKC